MFIQCCTKHRGILPFCLVLIRNKMSDQDAVVKLVIDIGTEVPCV